MPERRQAKMLPAKLAALIVALKEGEYNRQELAQLTDLHYLTVVDYCAALHDKRLIHICKYEKDNLGRESVVIFKFGEGEDVVREKLTRAEQQRRYRQRKIKRREASITDFIVDRQDRLRRPAQAVPVVENNTVFAAPQQPLPNRTTPSVHELFAAPRSSNDEGEE